MVKNACLWGSLIPAIVYIIWTTTILIVISNVDENFFRMMIAGKATNVGELIAVLSRTTSIKSIQSVIWISSFLAILTSILGVGLALLEIFQKDLSLAKKYSVPIIIFIPALISLFVPDAFIRILNISGIILAIIAIVSPAFIWLKMHNRGIFKQELLIKDRSVVFFILFCGALIIFLGLLDLA